MTLADRIEQGPLQADEALGIDRLRFGGWCLRCVAIRIDDLLDLLLRLDLEVHEEQQVVLEHLRGERDRVRSASCGR